jgi:hypothetical protein
MIGKLSRRFLTPFPECSSRCSESSSPAVADHIFVRGFCAHLISDMKYPIESAVADFDSMMQAVAPQVAQKPQYAAVKSGLPITSGILSRCVTGQHRAATAAVPPPTAAAPPITADAAVITDVPPAIPIPPADNAPPPSAASDAFAKAAPLNEEIAVPVEAAPRMPIVPSAAAMAGANANPMPPVTTRPPIVVATIILVFVVMNHVF